MEKNFNLVILTSDVLLQHVKPSLNFLCLLAFQLDNGTAVEADLLIHVVHSVLLFVEGDVNILKAVMDGVRHILQLVCSPVKSRDPIVEMIIHCCHGSLQFLVTPLGGINLINKTVPNVVQHLDSPIGLHSVHVELQRASIKCLHPQAQTLMLA